MWDALHDFGIIYTILKMWKTSMEVKLLAKAYNFT